jgi:hypothetical protein
MLHKLIVPFAKRRVIKMLSEEKLSKESFDNLIWYQSNIILLNCKIALLIICLIGLSTIYFSI